MGDINQEAPVSNPCPGVISTIKINFSVIVSGAFLEFRYLRHVLLNYFRCKAKSYNLKGFIVELYPLDSLDIARMLQHWRLYLTENRYEFLSGYISHIS